MKTAALAISITNCCVTLIAVAALAGCQTYRSHATPPASLQQGANPSPGQTSDNGDITDPTCCDPSTSNGLKDAWKVFLTNSPYRLASTRDMKDPIPRRTFVYAWGDLNYNHEPGFDHLAAIVVDSSRTDAARFG